LEKIRIMRRFISNVVCSVLLGGLLFSSCKKDDPAPLGAQTNAKFLAGEKGKTKSWKLREFTYQVGTNPSGTLTLVGCFGDNLYTFSNNDSQDYNATEGASKCGTSDPDAIEGGTWAFTLDGLTLNVQVDNTQTPNGLFSPEIYVETNSNNEITDIYNGGYTPYPAGVKKIDDNNLVLEINAVRGGNTVKYTLTLTPA
jgi:hypothetical protein